MALNARKNQPLKIKRYEKDIAAHYKREFERMKQQRRSKHTGRLEFEAWNGEA